MMAGRLRRQGKRARGERGQVLVEFALVAIVFFMFLFGIFDMARLFQSWVTVQHAAREAARYAITARHDCEGASTRDACIAWTARDSTTGISGGGADGGDVSVTFKAWDYPAYSGATNGETGGACDQIEVTVHYTHHFVTPLLDAIAPSGIDIQGSQRMTNEPSGPCRDGDGVG